MADEEIQKKPQYDPLRIRTLVNSAKSYAMHPAGEIVAEMAQQLAFAVEQIDTRSSAAHRAETDLITVRRQADADAAVYAELRKENDAMRAELKKLRPAVTPAKKAGRPKKAPVESPAA